MSDGRPIVIAYVLAGVGHQRAAEALAQVIRARSDRPVHVIDALAYMPGWFGWLVPRLYVFCVHRLPLLWAISFYLTDRPWVERLTGAGRRWLTRQMSGRLLAWLRDIQPQAFICTHFMPSEVVGEWKQRHLPQLLVWNVITDYRPHVWWAAPGVDRWFVGLPETQAALERLGVPSAAIAVSGIPVDEVFTQAATATVDHAALGLADDRLTLLITSGGYGIGPMERVCQSLLALPVAVQARLQLLLVAGRNPQLEARLTRLVQGAAMPVRVYGFTREMHQLMRAADVIVTKPGGLTVTEAMVLGRPLLLFAPIWGQETGNAELLVQHGAAQLVARPDEAGAVVSQWLAQPEILARMRAAIAALPHHAAARTIVEQLS